MIRKQKRKTKVLNLSLGLMLISGVFFNVCLSQENEQLISQLNEVFIKFKSTIKVEYGDLNFSKIDKVEPLNIEGIETYYPDSKFYIADIRVEQFGMPIVLKCIVKQDIEVVSVFVNLENPESVDFYNSLALAVVENDQMIAFSKCIFNLLSSALIETRPPDCSGCRYKSSKLIVVKEGNRVEVTELINLFSNEGKTHANWINRGIIISFTNQKIVTIESYH